MKPRSYLAGHEGAALVSTFVRLASRHGAAAIQRMVDALDVTLGTKAHQYPDASYFPEATCIPGLHPQPWHDPTSPALSEITTLLEGSFPAIREEAAALLNRPECFSPYAVEPRQAVRLSGMRGDWQVCFLKHPLRSTEVQRNRGLGRSLDWVPPASTGLPELTPTTRLRSRDRGTYLILKCSSAGQPPQMQIEYRDRILEIDPEWIPFFELVLSGQEFQVSDAVRVAPPGQSNLAPEYIQTLREEHLLEAA
jgi:hypothetical protein